MLIYYAASTKSPFRLSLKSISLASNRLQAILSYERRNGSPGYSPFHAVFSVPRSLCGAAPLAALSGSFGHLCASRNARVTGFALRGHQVVYAKSPTAHIRYSSVPSQYSPSTGQALAHRSWSRKGQSPKSAVIRGLQNNMPPTTSAHNPFGANLLQVARLKLLGSVYLIGSLPAFYTALWFAIFSVKRMCTTFLKNFD